MTSSSEADQLDMDILHLDMDCFFAAVEVRSNPALAGKPVVVGGEGSRGVVASASYEARAYGIRSAAPMAVARSLCPNLVVLPGQRALYSEVSHQLMEILAQFTPLVEPVSLDEAFLDVSGAHGIAGSSLEIGWSLRSRVVSELSLQCSVGIGRTKLVAKLASNAAKPHPSHEGPRPGPGVVMVSPAEERTFLHGHHVRAIPGIGPRTAERLARLGITKVGELSELHESTLIAHFGRAHGKALFDLASGNDDRRVVVNRAMQSIGHEQTFDVDLYDEAVLATHVRELAGSVASRCRASDTVGRTVALKVRFADFSITSRSRSGEQPIVTGAEIGRIACELLGGIDISRGVRLIGVSIANLEPTGQMRDTQLELFASDGTVATEAGADLAQRENLEMATDEIRRRFGLSAIASATTAIRKRAIEDDRAPE